MTVTPFAKPGQRHPPSKPAPRNPAIPPDDLRRALDQIADEHDCGHAFNVLGHLQSQQMAEPSVDLAAKIDTISNNIRAFDPEYALAVLGPPTAGSTTPPPPPPPAPTVLSPSAASPSPAAPAASAGSVLSSSRPGADRRERKIDLLALGSSDRAGRPRIDLLAASGPASIKAGPVDLVADMKRRHGVKA